MPFWPVICSETEISSEEYVMAVKKFNNESLWKNFFHHDYLAEELKYNKVKNLNQYQIQRSGWSRKQKPSPSKTRER